MSLYDFTVRTIQHDPISLSTYKDKVILIVNTASKCGFTPQLEGLETLYQTYKDQEFVVLGFPCNQFLRQDPKSNDAILEFCQLNYGVTFPMFEKINVKGKEQAPLYHYLVEQTGGKKVEWNFAKFLINQQGDIVARYHPKVTPDEIEQQIKTLLQNK